MRRKTIRPVLPVFPYQVELIPEIVKTLRAKGAEPSSFLVRHDLLGITQDILRAGRRPYLKLPVGEMVSFDEVYYNLSGEGEVSPDIRKELSHLEKVVSGATALTRRVAEVLVLVDELRYIREPLTIWGGFLLNYQVTTLRPFVRNSIPNSKG